MPTQALTRYLHVSDAPAGYNLKIASDGKTLDVSAIPRLINAYDEQALEAALRLRDAGVDCRITAVSIGRELNDAMKHCAALGADDIVTIGADADALDHHVVANILAAYIRSSGGADLVLCGRQASDDDQGVVAALLGEQLDMPIAPIARAVSIDGGKLRVTRVTPDGDEVAEAALPAVVTVSNELGEPRFPSARDKMAARKKQPEQIELSSLGLSAEALQPRVQLIKQYVPEVQGHCEFIDGTPAEVAVKLFEKLRADKLI